MPKHRKVPSLQNLCLKGIGSLVEHIASTITSKIQISHDPLRIISNLQQRLHWLSKLLVSHVPFYLYDTMAMEVLKSMKTLIEKTTSMETFAIDMNVVISLTEVVLTSHLKQIDFSEWPKIMRNVLYKNLYNLTGLEYLNIGSRSRGWQRRSEYDKCLLDGINAMKNLKFLCLCFDSTDIIVQIVGQNCPNIECLDLTFSTSVTDRSIPFLVECKNLKKFQLHQTSVTTVGFAQLILGLPKLLDIGRCDEFGNVVNFLYHNSSSCGPFNLKKIQTRDLSTECLRLFIRMFPEVEYISLFRNEQISDLTVLISLDSLRELKLVSCAFYGHNLKQLLEVRGNNITSLHLEHVYEMDFKVLIYISTYCSMLKNLAFYYCAFMSNSFPTQTFNIHPFLSLERIFWIVDSAAIYHLEFILTHALNIWYIHLGSFTGITHSNLVNVLNVNPMKKLEELRVLYSSDMSMRTVELILDSCTNIKILSKLESWKGITMEEFKNFEEHIYSNNFDLNIRPSLSCAT